jgi:hypothetical protein
MLRLGSNKFLRRRVIEGNFADPDYNKAESEAPGMKYRELPILESESG